MRCGLPRRLRLLTGVRRLAAGRLRRTAGFVRALRRFFLATGFFLRRLLAAIILRVAAFCAAVRRFFLATGFFLRAFRRLLGLTKSISADMN